MDCLKLNGGDIDILIDNFCSQWANTAPQLISCGASLLYSFPRADTYVLHSFRQDKMPLYSLGLVFGLEGCAPLLFF